MNRIILLVTIVSLFSNYLAFGDDEATTLAKGQPAPFSGFLITREKAEKIRLMDLNLQFQTKRGDILQTQVNLLQDQNNKNIEHISNLSSTIAESKSDNIYGKIGFFVLGAVLTGFVSYGIYRSAK